MTGVCLGDLCGLCGVFVVEEEEAIEGAGEGEGRTGGRRDLETAGMEVEVVVEGVGVFERATVAWDGIEAVG